MNVLAYDPYPAANSGLNYVSLDEIFEKSDIISLHCPLTSDSYHLINAETIAKMKDGIYILNTSRGALIDSEALLEGIKNEKIGGAALDVYEEEAEFSFVLPGTGPVDSNQRFCGGRRNSRKQHTTGSAVQLLH